jgi:alpha-methylacyl-CoA racemase
VNVKNGGKGQVIDVAMTDGAASLSTMFFGMKAMGVWTDDRESNLLDGGAHFYDTYECSDGKWVSIGSIEPQFYALLLEKTGVTDPEFKSQMDRSKWGPLKAKLTAIFKGKTRDEWCAIMEGTDICFAPVLSMAEAPSHPHNVERKTFVEVEGVVQPAPAPRFSGTPAEIQRRPAGLGEHTDEILRDWHVSR